MSRLLTMSLDEIVSEAQKAIKQGKKKIEAVADKGMIIHIYYTMILIMI